jgi:hypothetical protein
MPLKPARMRLRLAHFTVIVLLCSAGSLATRTTRALAKYWKTAPRKWVNDALSHFCHGQFGIASYKLSRISQSSSSPTDKVEVYSK